MKKLLILLLSIISCFGVFYNVKAQEITDVITLKSIKTISYMDGINVHVKKGANGEYVYCIEANKGDLYAGNKLYLDGVIDDAGMSYLMANGYPNKTMTKDNDKDYYITQVAVWLYYNEVYNVYHSRLGSYLVGNHVNSPLTPYIDALYKGAVEAHKKGFIKPTLNVNSNNNLTLNGSYYESDLVTVKLVGSKEYNVTITNNDLKAIITDKNGNVKDTFKSNEQFMVKVPSDISKVENIDLTITIKASGIIDKVYKYRPGNSERQKVVYGAIFGIVVPLSKNIDFSYKTVSVEFSKIDVTTNKELAGAHLEIRDENNKLIKEWVSTTKTKTFSLMPGKYSLIETIAPEGYQLSKEKVSFTVYANGTTSKVTMQNKPLTIVEFKKIDATNGKDIKGAKLEIRDSNNNLVSTWTSDGKSKYIKLKPGKYTLTETIAPTGYELIEEKISFEVLEDGETKVVTVKNAPYIDVPKTALNASQIVIILGGLFMLFGISVVYKNVKPKNQ